jgi:hypothetical protein
MGALRSRALAANTGGAGLAGDKMQATGFAAVESWEGVRLKACKTNAARPVAPMAEGIEYKGYTVVLLRRAAGWRIYIRPPDAPMRRAEFPAALSREEVIAEATRLIDASATDARRTR